MRKTSLAAIAVVIAAAASPALAAKPDCYGGYKTFLGKVNPHIGKIEDVDLPTLMRRGLSIYDACFAADNFPANSWDDLVTQMESATKKK
jgi:hypothetical protein